MAKNVILFIILLIYSTNSNSQELILPMDISPSLSGNFGELRNNHFHSGIDFKTQGKTGLPVKSVKDGYVSRIFVSPTGFGRAIYVNHPDGTMTVYGHVERFSNTIEPMVVDKQYKKESFSLNLSFPQGKIPVKKGEIIAYSGNTGSSGGPHLHFEIRNTSGEVIMDPLPFYYKQIPDTRAPEVRSLMFFPQEGKGIINSGTKDQVVPILKNKAGKQVLSKSVTAWGEIGIGVKAYDLMNGVSNIYGVKEIILTMDGKKIFHSRIDRFSFSESRYINSFISWEDWTNNRSFHMKSFVEPGNKLPIYKMGGNGIININEERVYAMEYSLIDTYGNKTVFGFSITGKKMTIPQDKNIGTLCLYNNDNTIKEKGLLLNIPQGNLYKNTYLKVDLTANYTPFSPLYNINGKIPLHTACPLTLDITNDTYPDKSKYGVVSVNGKGESWIGGEYKIAKMQLNIRQTGNFAVRIDPVPPTISPVDPAKWQSSKKISFVIKDKLSGISSWRGTLNGKFALFEFDAKKNSLFYIFDPDRTNTGEQKLVLKVTDGAGNTSTYERQIIF